jgi:hypothetical protein
LTGTPSPRSRVIEPKNPLYSWWQFNPIKWINRLSMSDGGDGRNDVAVLSPDGDDDGTRPILAPFGATSPEVCFRKVAVSDNEPRPRVRQSGIPHASLALASWPQGGMCPFDRLPVLVWQMLDQIMGGGGGA